jgi:Ca-activated chloride channel family protein
MKTRQIPSEPFGLEAWLEKSRIILPLRGLSVRADITAGFADVEVDQLFEQNNEQPLDCRFLFPLPADAAVYRCEMRVNGRVIVAKTEKRSEARQLFKQAKAKGRRAALTESERDNLFTLSLGNLQPGDIVLMRFAYLQPVQRLRERRTLRIPVNPGVRYIPGEPLLRENTGLGATDDTNLVPDASRITPPRIGGDHPDAATLHASVRLRGAGDFTDSASSPSHPVVLRQDGDDLVAALAINGHLPNRDFVFTYNEKPPVAPVVRAWLDENRRGLLEIRLPEAPAAAQAASPPDVYFLLDHSGSMDGDNWTGACKALAAFIPRLDRDTRVWLTLFESGVRDFETAPVRAADLDFGPDGEKIRRIGTAGGTELVPALRHLGEKIKEHSKERIPAVLVITDGEIGNEHGAVSAAKQLGCPVHIVGVAMTANDGLDAVAKQTGARSIFLAPGEDIAGAVERFTPVLRPPVVTGLTIPAGWTTAEDTPLRDLCDADDTVIPISAAMEARDLDLGGRVADGAAWSVVPERQNMTKAGLIWARSRIRHLDASDCEDQALVLAKEFNLLSSDAAFVAWDEAEQVPVAQGEIIQPALDVETGDVRGYSACCAPPPSVKYFSVGEGDDPQSYRSAPSGPRKRRLPKRRNKKDHSLGTLLMLPFAVVYALIEYLSPDNDAPTLRPDLAELVDRLRQLVDMVYPGRSFPHEVRDALQQIKATLAKLEKSSEAERAELQEEAVDNLERMLQSLREHSRQRQQEMHENARRFADLEHTAARLAIALQEEIVRSKALLATQTP